MINEKQKAFYDKQYSNDSYAPFLSMEDHYYYGFLTEWIKKHPRAKRMKWLEIGSGRGAMQDIVEDYTGLDVTEEVSKYYHKRYVVGDATSLPFQDGEFDVIWTCSVYEMIPEVEKALNELLRVLRPGGTILFAPAWHVRPWAAKGYRVRPYSDFNLFGKIYKFLIPLMEWLPIRALAMFPKRVLAMVRYAFNRKMPLQYRKLKPEYGKDWVSDSDACNSLDPFLTILWFKARGCRCITYRSYMEAFLSRNGPVEFRKRKR